MPDALPDQDSTSGTPWLSVIMPVYNGARYLAESIESVLRESQSEIEILVADDGSTDGSGELIAGYATRGRLTALRGPGRGNWVSNCNFAASHARGRYLTILHQDDVWLRGRMKVLRQAVASAPDRSVWIGPTRYLDAGGRRLGNWNLPFRRSATSVEGDVFLQHILVQNFIGMPTPIFTRTAFDRAGGLDEDLWFTADWDLWIKLAIQDGVGLYPSATAAFRLHPESQTMQRASAYQAMRSQIDAVRHRYLCRIPEPSVRSAVERAGRFSSELNAGLASLVAGQSFPIRPVLNCLLRLGVSGACRFLRDSRIFERSIARVRIGFS